MGTRRRDIVKRYYTYRLSICKGRGHPRRNLDFGAGPLPRRPTRLPHLYELGLALRYQLIERTHFVAAPDPLVAGLLADWAHLELLAGAQPTAAVLYKAALDYGHPITPMIRSGKAQSERTLSPAEADTRRRDCELCPPLAD